MSQEAIARFLELVASDGSVEAAMNEAAQQKADVPATAVGIGEKHGLEFTKDEFASAIEAFHREHAGELDDAELEGVSGGFTPQPEPPGIWDMGSDSPWHSQPWAINLRRGP